MTTSGVYTFSTSAASGLTLVAFSRIGLRDSEVTMQHLTKAAVEANLLQSSLASQQPHLWQSTLTTISLTAGTSNYALPSRMVAIQDIFLTITSGGVSTDRMMAPISLFDYDAQPNKTTQAVPTIYVVFKTLSPTITFWPVPDSNATYTASVRYLSQMQDASQVSGTSLDMPYIYLDVYVAGLAYRLARIYAPDKEQLRKADYDEALAAAEKTDTQDNVMMAIMPDLLSAYYR